MNDQTIEKQIQAAGKTAPRVTPQHIESVIAECHYINAGEAAQAGWPDKSAMDDCSPALNLLTICVLVLRNGFTVTGESACASPENFDAEIGRKIARDNAVQKIWPLEGYLLKQHLYQQCTDERMCENCYSGQAPCKNNQPTRGQMIEYVQQAIKEGYTSYYGLPEGGIAWLSDECLKVDYGVAWEYYNLAADENGRAPLRDLGE